MSACNWCTTSKPWAEHPVATERASLRDLIGGRWAVSWQGYLLAWPWAVLFIFSTSPTVWATGTLVERILRGIIVGTVTYVPVGIVTWVASKSILRNRCITPAPILLVALVGGIAWTTRSLAMIGYLSVSGTPSDASPAIRLIAGFLQGALAFVLAAWLIAKLTSFHEQRRRLLDELVQEELANDQLHERVMELETSIVNQVRRRVAGRTADITLDAGRRSPDSRDVEALAQATQQISKDLARELWDDAVKSVRIRPMAVVRSTATNRPFAYWALLPGALLGVVGLSISWSLADSVIAVGILTLYALGISSAANALCHRMRASLGLVLYGASIALLLASALVMAGIISLLLPSPSWGAGLLWAVAVNYGVFYPLVGVGAHLSRAQNEALARLRRSISQTEVQHHALRREESRLRRDLAMALHGGLQADLTASTMRAQQAIDQGDPTRARRALDEARDLIQRGWDAPALTRTDLRSTALTVVESWEGFVDITLDITVTHEPASRAVAAIKEILLEGIGNAVRHGHAKNIAICIDDWAGDLRVTITDDGVGTSGSRTGLGSAMLDDIAPDAWSLSPATAGGSRLTVELPTAPRL